jgi:hypothetical protein
MYEMEGGLARPATPRWPVARLTRRNAPPAGFPVTRARCQFPGSSRVPGLPPAGSRSER